MAGNNDTRYIPTSPSPPPTHTSNIFTLLSAAISHRMHDAYRTGLNIYATVCDASRTDWNTLQLQSVGASYLLIEQGPEHGQRDVEDQNAQHHLDLLDQAFLMGERQETRGAGWASEFRPETRRLGCEFLLSYRVLVLGPVQPVVPLRLALWPLPASFDGELSSPSTRDRMGN